METSLDQIRLSLQVQLRINRRNHWDYVLPFVRYYNVVHFVTNHCFQRQTVTRVTGQTVCVYRVFRPFFPKLSRYHCSCSQVSSLIQYYHIPMGLGMHDKYTSAPNTFRIRWEIPSSYETAQYTCILRLDRIMLSVFLHQIREICTLYSSPSEFNSLSEPWYVISACMKKVLAAERGKTLLVQLEVCIRCPKSSLWNSGNAGQA